MTTTRRTRELDPVACGAAGAAPAEPVRSVLWHFAGLPATERCVLWEGDDAHRLEGTVLTAVDGRPTEIRYAVDCDGAWPTRRALVEILSDAGTRTLRLAVDPDGRWTLDGAQRPELAGLVDVDLGFSPCTNTLPIRRLGLEVGQSASVSVVWLRFPDLEVLRLDQSYTRTGPRAYRYESRGGEFRAELEVDELGLVTRYGDFWRRLATS